ncbi:MAG: AzlC family ABC transporter permease [Desulfobacterales bacterium]|nr:AzlC family ABC transporter permease [Desulfobacterales bacterium]
MTSSFSNVAVNARSEFLAGARDTIPLIVGAIPFGIIFGALAGSSGLSFAAAMAMSMIVFAGSSQFIAIGLVAAGAGWPMIVLTTFVVNLRHLLYGATLAPYFKSLSRTWRIMLAFGLTDEAFVVSVRRYEAPDSSPYKHIYNLGSALFMYTNWSLCTMLGLSFGRVFPRIAEWGLDFAMIATFIGMVIPYLVSKPMWIAVLTAGAVSLALNHLPNKLGLVIAALAGLVAGILCESLVKEEKKS